MNENNLTHKIAVQSGNNLQTPSALKLYRAEMHTNIPEETREAFIMAHNIQEAESIALDIVKETIKTSRFNKYYILKNGTMKLPHVKSIGQLNYYTQ